MLFTDCYLSLVGQRGNIKSFLFNVMRMVQYFTFNRNKLDGSQRVIAVMIAIRLPSVSYNSKTEADGPTVEAFYNISDL